MLKTKNGDWDKDAEVARPDPSNPPAPHGQSFPSEVQLATVDTESGKRPLLDLGLVP